MRDRSRISNGGFKSRCRECDRKRSKLYYQRVRERKLAAHREKRIAKHGPRMCARGCGRKATSQKHIYCGPCRQQAIDDRLQRRGKMSMWGLMLAREKDARRTARRKELGLTTRLRGYDRPYEVLKQDWQLRIDSGEEVRCHDQHCLLRDAEGRPGLIRTGDPWDLGHASDRSIRGPEHRRCNRATARLERRRERERAA